MLGRPILPIARRHNISVFTRVPHSSGLLEGAYTEQTSFDRDGHRSFSVADDQKRKARLLDGFKKVEKLSFLTQNTRRSLV
jgi:aryl-alcohol dehydrogenase-like predicted oxidoreductase